MSEDTSQELPAGQRLGDYVIERTLGQGGFGITYLATDCSKGTRVVIKENLPFNFAYRESTSLVVRSRRSSGDAGSYEWAVDNFMNEARTLARLDHPNIVKVLRAFKALGTAYFVMPFVEGVSMDKYRGRHGQPTEEWLRGFLLALLDALAYLHGKNILHRDVKPGNILLTEMGTPQLIDFGTARQLISEKSQTVIESPGYTPIEQMQTHGKTGPWSDLYALGGTIYKLITGETPLKSTDRVGKTDPQKKLAEMPELRGAYSFEFLSSVDKALEMWPEDRWQSAEEWREALQRGAAPVDPAPSHDAEPEERRKATKESDETSQRYVTTQGETEEEPSISPKPPIAKPEKSKRKLFLWVGLVLLACVGGVCFASQQAWGQFAFGRFFEMTGNLSSAAEWYSKAAEQEHADAKAKLAEIELEILRRGAEQEDAESQYQLARRYETGEGVQQDVSEAVKWYRKAAEQGERYAQNNLGWCYQNGTGVAKDEVEAARLWAKAAAQGYGPAQCMLGWCYECGVGVSQDATEAVKWYRKAAEQGYEGATRALNRLRK